MSRSNDPAHFFQTSTSLSEEARKLKKSSNKNGNPIKLASKILALAADPADADKIFAAEAVGTVRRVSLETGKTTHLYTGPAAPVTCLALSTINTSTNTTAATSPSSSRTLFAGCWDKTIWSWCALSRAPRRRYAGHADFVKALATLRVPGRDGELLVSGAADAAVIVWDAGTGEKLHVLNGHVRGVLALAVDPFSGGGWGIAAGGGGGGDGESGVGEVEVFSACSDREIRRWRIGASTAREIESAAEGKGGARLLDAHETSVNALVFEDGEDADLWTASSDKTAKRLARERGWEADMVLEHPDFVRDVVVDLDGGWVVTACRDEEVRVWEAGGGDLHHVFSGHFEEVTALLLLPGQKLVSASIDATIRQWSLKHGDIRQAKELAAKLENEGDTLDDPSSNSKNTGLTEEEERELAELMEDSD